MGMRDKYQKQVIVFSEKDQKPQVGATKKLE